MSRPAAIKPGIQIAERASEPRWRVVQFAYFGAIAAVAIAAIGFYLDTRVPHVRLEEQFYYNWLSLFFSPASFLLRLSDPDGPIVGSIGRLLSSVVLNAIWFGLLRFLYVAIIARRAESDSSSLSVEETRATLPAKRVRVSMEREVIGNSGEANFPAAVGSEQKTVGEERKLVALSREN